jgi:hypothetical protein
MGLTHYLLLALLFYAPWHANRFIFGEKSAVFSLQNFWFVNVDVGIFELLNALTAFSVASLLSLHIFRGSHLRKIELFLFAPLFLVIIRMVYWDKHGILALINSISITVLLFWILSVLKQKKNWIFFFALSRKTFLISVSLSLFLPLLFGMFGLSIDIFDLDAANFHRYRGWFELPVSAAFLALIGFCWTFTFFRRSLGWQTIAVSILSLGFFLIAFMTTHRTMLLAITGFLVGQIWVYRKNRRMFYIALIFLVFPIVSQFIGAVGAKNNFGKNSFLSSEQSQNSDFEGYLVHTSGRVSLYPLLVREALEQPILGRGTGASSRFLSDSKYKPFFGAEPNSEILRIFLDLGLLGLLSIFFLPLLFLRQGYPYRRAFPLFLALMPVLFFENPFSHPNWFYLPFFWIIASEAADEIEA